MWRGYPFVKTCPSQVHALCALLAYLGYSFEACKHGYIYRANGMQCVMDARIQAWTRTRIAARLCDPWTSTCILHAAPPKEASLLQLRCARHAFCNERSFRAYSGLCVVWMTCNVACINICESAVNIARIGVMHSWHDAAGDSNIVQDC
jgi:hypothetical protein